METIEFVGIQNVALILLALAVLWVGWQLGRIHGDLARSSRSPLDRMMHQATANKLLIDTPEGRHTLLQFVLSEAAVANHLEAIETQIGEMNQYDWQRLNDALEKDDRNVLQRGWDWLKKNPGKLAGKLFDKANDLVKSAIGLGS